MRQYMGGGRRGPWIGGDAAAPPPFQRADGSVMTEQEIKAVASVDASDFKKSNSTLRGRQPIDAENVWNTVQRLGTQTAAARELKTSQGTIQSALKRYMRDHGINGPLPGLLPRVTVEPSATTSTPVNGAADGATPLIGFVVHHGDPDARAAAFNEGYDKAVEDYTPPKAIDALIDWLTENGPHWNDVEAERWLKAFTATIDLVYPTRAPA